MCFPICVRVRLHDMRQAPEVTQELAASLTGRLLLLDWPRQNRIGSFTLVLVLLGVGLLAEQGQIGTPEAALALLISDNTVSHLVFREYIVVIIKQECGNTFTLVFRSYSNEVELYSIVVFFGLQ